MTLLAQNVRRLVAFAPSHPGTLAPVIALLACLLVPSYASAQTAPSVTVAAGVNVARISLPFPDFDFEELELTLENGSRIGFVGGLFVDFGVQRSPIGFTTGALYSERGGKMTAEILGFGAADIDFCMRYLDVPLLARFRVSGNDERGFAVLAGGMAGLRLNARTKVSALGQSESESFTDALPVFDFGLTIGGRADFGRANVTAYYTHGLVDLTEGLSPDAIKHRVFSVLAGWRF